MADAGLTHVAHLLTGLSPGATLRWLTYPELRSSCQTRNVPVPCKAAHLDSLILSLPQTWRDTINHARSLKQRQHSLPDLLSAMPTVAGIWYRHGHLAGTPASTTPSSSNATINLNYHVNPIGVLTPTRTPTSAPWTHCTQIHVWGDKQQCHNQTQREARQRALDRKEPDPFPITLLTSGSVADPAILPGCGSPHTPTGANPSHFSISYPPTDRLRQPTTIARADVNHFYLALIGELHAPIRTLDPNHNPTTQTSTSYAQAERD